MGGGTVVVTGGASGIGRRAVVLLARTGHHVVVVARSDARAAEAVADASAAASGGGRVVSVPADLADLGAVRRAVGRISALGPVRAVVNNAAILAVARRRPRSTVDGIEEILAVNHVAAFVLTTGLLPRLAADGRVVVAGSKGLAAMPWIRLDPDDLDSRRRWSPVSAYYRSKLAQLAFAVELRRRGVAATAVRIPSVRLDDDRLTTYPRLLRLAYRPKQRWAIDPVRVARSYVDLVDRALPLPAHVEVSGRAARRIDAVIAPDIARRVWDATAELARPGRRPAPPTERTARRPDLE